MRSRHPGRFAILMALVVTGLIILSDAAGQPKRPLTIPVFTYAALLRSLTVTIASTAYPFIFDTGGGETATGNAVFGTAPIGAGVWLSVLPFAASMLTVEEARKFIVRWHEGASSISVDTRSARLDTASKS